MSLRVRILGLVWLAAVTARAEEQGEAPLEGSRQELKRLQADQAAKSSAAVAGNVTEGLPQILTPVPGAVQLEMPSLKKAEKERRKKMEEQKNWLLDGVDLLGKSPKVRGREPDQAAEAFTDKGKKESDSSDPNHMLKLYAEQKKTSEAKSDQLKLTAPRVDPLAPFLQGWLETSPVRGKFFDDFVRRPDAAGGVPGPGPAEHSMTQVMGSGDVAGSARAAPATVQPNPYLQGLDTLALQDLGTSRNQAATVSTVFSNPAPVQPTGGLGDPIPAGHPVEKKPLVLMPSDDKKYFPQLKKF
jgi:hypothetical protein